MQQKTSRDHCRAWRWSKVDQMTQSARWRLAHILAAVLGGILLALSARHALILTSPDLRTGAFTTSSTAAMMVGVILLIRFLSSRQQPTLYLAVGFLGSGMLLAVHAVFENRTSLPEPGAMSFASC